MPLYDFAVQVWSKRKTITVEEWEDLLVEYSPTPLDDEVTLIANQVLIWDTFIFHCTQMQEVEPLDTCTYLLLANHWLESIPLEPTQKQLNRLLHSKLILPQFLKFEAVEEDEPESLMSMPPAPTINARRTIDKYISARAAAEARIYLDSLRHLEGQLGKAHKKYIKLESENLKAYNAEYDALLREYYAQFPSNGFIVSGDGGGGETPIPDAEITDEDPPTLPMPIYDYQPLVELDEERLEENLDESSIGLLNELKDTQVNTFSEVFELIDVEKKRHQETRLANNTTSETLINQDGMLLRVGEGRDTFSTPGDGTGSGNEGGTTFIPVKGASVRATQLPGSPNRWYFIITLEMRNSKVSFPISGVCRIEDVSSEEVLGEQNVQALEDAMENFYNLTFFTSGPNYIQVDPEADVNVRVNAKIFLNNSQYEFEDTVLLAKTPITTVTVKPGTGGETPIVNVEIFSNISKWGISRIGIGDYIKVTEKLCRYEPGEVAHIENVMAKEYREKFSRRFSSSELTETSEESYESEQQTDTSSSERYETSREISKIQQTGLNINNTTNIKFGEKFQNTLGIAYNNNREQAERMASTSSRELSEQATQRILIRKREERVRRLVNEFTEENRHGYDNRKGGQHVTGVYRWVDRIYKHTLTNYGKRLMYEFQVPEPASMHRLYVDNTNVEKLVKPIDPRDGTGSGNDPLKTYQNITEDNFAFWAAAYKAEVNPPPPASIVAGKAFSGSYEESQGYGRAAHFDELEVPEGYKLTRFDFAFHLEKHMKNIDGKRCGGTFSVGSYKSSMLDIKDNTYSRIDTVSVDSSQNTTGTIPVSVTTHDIGGFALNINATFQRLPSKFDEWRIQTFNSIITAYEEALAVFEERARRIADQQQQKLMVHPRYYREIEEKVLKKNCIAYLFEKLGVFSPAGFISGEGISTHKVNRSPALDQYASIVKFLEQAFEWEQMTYIFYPFYWANKTSWSHLYHNPCEDQLFKNFLESGFARVIVSVRPGFEDAVSWYMQTGQVWIGKDAPVLDEEEYLSIIEDLQNQEPKVIDQWEVRLPSSLTVLQNSGVGLVASGLPDLCGNDPVTLNFSPSDSKLIAKDEEEEIPETPEN